MHTLSPLLAAALLTGCASTTVYQPMTATGKDGVTHTKAVKVFAVQGDISGAFTLTTQPGCGGVTLEVKPLDAGQVLMQRIAVTDGKGNPLRDKAGNAVYNEIPLVAGLNHSRPTGVAWDGVSQSLRSVGSVVGTIAASVMGTQAATSLAGAIHTP
jgi:hypothetical protein